jgi:3-dehydroquinate synthase
MDVLKQQFAVNYAFDVHFTRDVFAPDNDCLATALRGTSQGRASRALVYVDAGVAASTPDLPRRIHSWFATHESQGVELAASPEIVSGGEVTKGDLAILDRVGTAITQHRLCRHSYVVIIGGGAVLDAVGCAASLIHRGLRQIRLPTTTLAQCDAGLGVKNGLNRFGAKNFYGTFTPPHAIINDTRFLEHLDDRSWRAGIAEAVKVAIIKDRDFLFSIEQDAVRLAARDIPAMERLIRRCAELHLEHITGAGDPFEQGSSRPLDFGHWSAHRLEILTNHRLLHGEAVAIGVAIDVLYAVEIGRLQLAEAELVLRTLQCCGFKLWDVVLDLKDADGQRSVYAGLEQFREHLGGELTLAMPDRLGSRRDITEFDHRLCERAMSTLKRWRVCNASIATE